MLLELAEKVTPVHLASTLSLQSHERGTVAPALVSLNNSTFLSS